ncbi:hypothetical protein JL108_13110 [Aeromicrobium sp. YIM 150415]|uniref:YciI family protein n=1 Tax=Aeromicrobium sp. YIM 150415 TaxID=2803912 RepID=UPI001965E993|nr:YciI family protein [Aeromicrobium sp. YIM 150415]MBM9464393.1 hypothetical protein [Aeromicrobium sp. YIM 150415]
MPLFLVRLVHPDEESWKRWVRQHVAWVQEHVAQGVIVASGPSVGTATRQGWLVMRAADESVLRELIATDPFWDAGVIEDLLIVQWDPIFGHLAELSSSPNGIDLSVLP